jgi:hypothetical protein
MGLLDGKRKVVFYIPKEQYDVLSLMFDAIQQQRPSFSPDDWFSKLIGQWLDKHWNEFIRTTFKNENTRKRKPKRK